MGDTISTPSAYEGGVEDNNTNHNLMRKISEDIASGNEGDMADMQIKNEFDPQAPHLYWHPSFAKGDKASGISLKTGEAEDEEKMKERSMTTTGSEGGSYSKEASLKNEELQIEKGKHKLIKKQLSQQKKETEHNPDSSSDESDHFAKIIEE